MLIIYNMLWLVLVDIRHLVQGGSKNGGAAGRSNRFVPVYRCSGWTGPRGGCHPRATARAWLRDRKALSYSRDDRKGKQGQP